MAPDAADDAVRAAYRRLVQLHHPDHNPGSPDAARRFEQVRVAYVTVMEQRRSAAAAADADPDLEARLAALEREVLAAQAAKRPSGRQPPPRPSDAELGYVSTDDTFTQILDDLLGGA